MCLLIGQLQANFSSDKQSLIGDAIRENRQTFMNMPTLGDLRWTIVAITQVLRRYELFRVRLSRELSETWLAMHLTGKLLVYGLVDPRMPWRGLLRLFGWSCHVHCAWYYDPTGYNDNSMSDCWISPFGSGAHSAST